MAAIAAEYGSLSRTSPESMLLLLEKHLSRSGRKQFSFMSASLFLIADLRIRIAAVQEALLLSMLRISARCAEPSLLVNDSVRRLADRSRRHIKFVEWHVSQL